MCEEVVEGVPGEVQRSAGLVRVEQPDHVHAKVPLQPLHVGVGAVKHLRRAGKNGTEARLQQRGTTEQLQPKHSSKKKKKKRHNC